MEPVHLTAGCNTSRRGRGRVLIASYPGHAVPTAHMEGLGSQAGKCFLGTWRGWAARQGGAPWGHGGAGQPGREVLPGDRAKAPPAFSSPLSVLSPAPPPQHTAHNSPTWGTHRNGKPSDLPQATKQQANDRRRNF
jgi:hypothetical protein